MSLKLLALMLPTFVAPEYIDALNESLLRCLVLCEHGPVNHCYANMVNDTQTHDVLQRPALSEKCTMCALASPATHNKLITVRMVPYCSLHAMLAVVDAYFAD